MYKLTETDFKIMDAASKVETGGMATFTAHYFSPINGVPRWDLVWRDKRAARNEGFLSDAWDNRVPPDEWDFEPEKREYVPWIPLSWQMQLAHDERSEATVIAGFGAGKTVGAGGVLVYLACMLPQFRAMDVAPVGWQSKQMYDAIRQELIDYDNHDVRPTFGSQLVHKMIERPYPKITFYNGSTIEFMSADENGRKILSWNGDLAVIDEAGKLSITAGTDLDELIMNLGSRLRGISGTRERMGRLIVLSNADYDPALWQRFDYAETLPDDYLSLIVKTSDNPYVTRKQLADFERRIPDEDKRRQFMDAERPLPKGNEFTPQLIERCQSDGLDEMMKSMRDSEVPGYEVVDVPRAGVVRWVIPPSNFERYILVGDPGQANPPDRNSPVIMVIKVTGFPQVPAELAAFSWTFGNGSYWPFINQFKEWFKMYRPIHASYDSTGTQKAFDELAFTQAGVLAEGLNMQTQKMQMVMALKLIMGKGMLLMPSRVQGIWMQLAGWQHPDKKLRQDIASTLFMAGHVLNRLFVINEEDEPIPGIDAPRHSPGRVIRTKNKRVSRSSGSRPYR